MPIQFQTPRPRDPNIDRYPWLEDASRIALAGRELGQGQQRIDLARSGQEAQIADANARLELARSADARQQEAFSRQRSLDVAGAAIGSESVRGIDAWRPVDVSKEGPMAPIDYETEAEKERVLRASEGMSNAAKALFLGVQAEAINERRLGRAVGRGMKGLSESAQAAASGPFAEQLGPYYEQAAQLYDMASQPGLDPRQRAEFIDNANAIRSDADKEHMKLQRVTLLRGDATNFIGGLMATTGPGSNARNAMLALSVLVSGSSDEDVIKNAMMEATRISIDMPKKYTVIVGGQPVDMTAKELSEHARDMEDMRVKKEIADSNNAARREAARIRASQDASDPPSDAAITSVASLLPPLDERGNPVQQATDGGYPVDGVYRFPVYDAGGGQASDDGVLGGWAFGFGKKPRYVERPLTDAERADIRRRAVEIMRGGGAKPATADGVQPPAAPSGKTPPPGMSDEEALRWHRENRGGV